MAAEKNEKDKESGKRPFFCDAQIAEKKEAILRYPSVERLRISVESHIITCVEKYFEKHLGDLNESINGVPPLRKKKTESPRPPAASSDTTKTDLPPDESNPAHVLASKPDAKSDIPEAAGSTGVAAGKEVITANSEADSTPQKKDAPEGVDETANRKSSGRKKGGSSADGAETQDS